MRKILVSFFTILLLSFLFASGASAATKSYLITNGFIANIPNSSGQGWPYFEGTQRFAYVPINLEAGYKVFLSANPDGTGEALVGESLQVINTVSGGVAGVYTFKEYDQNCTAKAMPPVDITGIIRSGRNNLLVRYLDWCINKNNFISSLYLVVTDEAPPAPFLDLPWDYEGKDMSFSEAANAINSYFDHEYPLLSKGAVLAEPEEAQDSLIFFRGGNRDTRKDYSSHDGYDYGSGAGTKFGEPVLAAAAGTATYHNNCGGCGNAIHIDHGNGFQTRYYHLQKDGLITDDPKKKIEVVAGQMIGKVGFSGNVRPKGEKGAHIHFMVVEDKDRDGDFEDNLPDGVTDPFGWQSKDPDPWEIYTFNYGKDEEGRDIQKTGNSSFYLWKEKIDGLVADLPSNGGVFSVNKYKVEFLNDSSRGNLKLEMRATPGQKISESLVSVGSTIGIAAEDVFGNLIPQFTLPFYLSIDFSREDLSRYDAGTLAIYSSIDGENWIKEEFTIDLAAKTLTASLKHLTYFALVASPKDYLAPTTTAILNGTTLELKASDNEGGAGIEYTAYQVGEQDWEEYKSPLNFTNNGDYEVRFYSEDKYGNVEEEKSVKFTINKSTESSGQSNQSSNNSSGGDSQVASLRQEEGILSATSSKSTGEDENEVVKGANTVRSDSSLGGSTGAEEQESVKSTINIPIIIIVVLGLTILFFVLKKWRLLRKRE